MVMIVNKHNKQIIDRMRDCLIDIEVCRLTHAHVHVRHYNTYAYLPFTRASTLHEHDSNGTVSSHESGHTK